MTDIWRSLIAQACLYATGKYLPFREAIVYQQRNAHDYLRTSRMKFHNSRLVEILADLRLSSNASDIPENLRTCYGALIAASLIPKQELTCLEAWLTDLSESNHRGQITGLRLDASDWRTFGSRGQPAMLVTTATAP
jgi:STELLO glycosyltransferases